MTRRVVVTGLGALTPIGNSVEAFWNGMMEGRSGAGPITHFDAEAFDTKFACEVKDFDPLEYMDRKMARRLDPFTQYGLAVAKQAVEDADLTGDGVDPSTVGVIFGSGIGGIQIFHQQTETYVNDGPKRLSPFFIPMLIVDMAPGLISMEYGFGGPNYSAVSACATGNNNIGDALMLIRGGMADVILCGGSEAAVCELGIGGFNAMKALSTRNDAPESASRPFDATRDGFVLGEGGGALVLEELEHALKRGAKIYAEVAGIGMSADAHHMTAPDPEGNGVIRAMTMMLRDAGIDASGIDYINMHGTSTPLGDVAESQAIEKVLGEHARTMNVSSTKSMTGHLLGAAGSIEAIASILAIQHNTVPPTINFEHPDERCTLNYTFNTPEERTVDVAASNAFGFGGHNTSVVFKRFAE